MAARRKKDDDTEVEIETKLEKKQRELTELSETTVTVNSVEFAVREFTEVEAELYDAHYREQGGQELDLEFRVLNGELEKLPQSKAVAVLNKRIVPLREQLEAAEKAYDADPTDENFTELLRIAEELDPLEAQGRKAIEHTDIETTLRRSDEIVQRSNELNTKLRAIHLDFCHRLALRDGKTAEPVERWRERATDVDRRAAGELIKKARTYLRHLRELKGQNVQETTQGETSAHVVN